MKRLFPPLFPLLFLLTACSSTAPSQGGPWCGEPILVSDVLVLDIEPILSDPDAVAAFVEREAGPHRLLTTEPVGLRVDHPRTIGKLKFVRTPVEEAAARGCDLMLVLGTETGNYPNVNSAYDSATSMRIQIVHLGVRENPGLVAD